MSADDYTIILNAIGQHVSDILDGEAEGAFLYVEAGEAWQEAAIFKQYGDEIIYRGPSRALFRDVENLWEAADLIENGP
jgi:hypothetical protein